LEEGVVGLELDPADFEELEEEASSLSPSDVSIATAGLGWEATALNRNGRGRALPRGVGVATGGGETRPSTGGGVIFTLGDLLLPLRTELLFPPRLHVEAESDLEAFPLAFVVAMDGLPRDVPPEMTVVELGVEGSGTSS
jgi:hypothetical protein